MSLVHAFMMFCAFTCSSAEGHAKTDADISKFINGTETTELLQAAVALTEDTNKTETNELITIFLLALKLATVLGKAAGWAHAHAATTSMWSSSIGHTVHGEVIKNSVQNIIFQNGLCLFFGEAASKAADRVGVAITDGSAAVRQAVAEMEQVRANPGSLGRQGGAITIHQVAEEIGIERLAPSAHDEYDSTWDRMMGRRRMSDQSIPALARNDARGGGYVTFNRDVETFQPMSMAGTLMRADNDEKWAQACGAWLMTTGANGMTNFLNAMDWQINGQTFIDCMAQLKDLGAAALSNAHTIFGRAMALMDQVNIHENGDPFFGGALGLLGGLADGNMWAAAGTYEQAKQGLVKLCSAFVKATLGYLCAGTTSPFG